ncbi:MAG: aminoacyl-tRNA hydrolase [Armatimonadetes bacterium]|nr:aminoacyl-tRNA hydrolase [Armatimonadota bacterium]
MKAIIGLGNPGRQYARTRHNVGFEVIARLSRKYGIPVESRRCQAQVGEGEIAGQHVLLARPQTFMNLSGVSVQALVRRYRLALPDILVVYDDANLPLGRLRLRASGSAGGHNGIKSLIASLGSPEFPRLKIGIGESGRPDLIDHVLSHFSPGEEPVIQQAWDRAAETIEYLLENGLEKAMNLANAGPQPPDKESPINPP